MAVTTNETTNYAEYTVERKGDFKLTLKKIGLWFCYIFLPLIILAVLCIICKGYEGYAIGIFLIIMIPLYYCNLLPKLIIPFTKIYYQVYYEYIVRQGTMTINKVLGKEDNGASGSNKFRKRKEFLAPVLVADMELVAPYEGEYKTKFDSESFFKVYDAFGSEKHEDNYIAIFKDSEGRKCGIKFQNMNKMLSTMHFLNSENVVKKQLTR